MDTLKKFFPYSFGVDSGKTLAIKIVVYIVANVVVGLVLGLIGLIPFVGFITDILGALVGLYNLAGIILAVLDFLKVFNK